MSKDKSAGYWKQVAKPWQPKELLKLFKRYVWAVPLGVALAFAAAAFEHGFLR